MKKSQGLFEATAWYGMGNFFVRAISFLLLPLYSNVIPAGEFGNYALLLSFYSIISVLFHGGLQSALSKFYLEEEEPSKRKVIFSTVINSVFIFSLIFALAGIIFSGSISTIVLGSEEYQLLVILTISALFTDNLGAFFLHYYKTNEQAKKVVSFSAASAIVNLAANLILVYMLNMGVEGIFISQVAASVSMLLMIFPRLSGEISSKLDSTILKKMLLFSFPLMLGGLLSTFTDVIDRFLIDHFLSREDVGIYSFNYKLAMIMNLFVIAFRAAWLPHSMNRYFRNDYSNFGEILTKLTGSSLVILTFVTIFTGYLYDFRISGVSLLNEAYKPGIEILPWVLAGYLFNGIASFYYVYPNVSGKSYHVLISDGGSFIVNIVLNLILIPQFGIIGAAIATAVSFFVSAAYLVIVTSFAIKIHYNIYRLLALILLTAIVLYSAIKVNNLILDLGLFIIFLMVNARILGIKLSSVRKTG